MKATLTIFALFLIALSFGQSNNYYMSKSGKIIDQQNYDVIKNTSIEKITKKRSSMQIIEDLNELYSRNDLSKGMTSINISNALGYMTASGEVVVEIGGENASLIAVWPEKGATLNVKINRK